MKMKSSRMGTIVAMVMALIIFFADSSASVDHRKEAGGNAGGRSASLAVAGHHSLSSDNGGKPGEGELNGKPLNSLI
ncbi:hypothetical protein OROGR_030452 [Orobanche gracilis]